MFNIKCFLSIVLSLHTLCYSDTRNDTVNLDDELIESALKPIKPIFDELDLKDEFPHLQESIKEKIAKEGNKTENIQYYMKYFYDKVNAVYEMFKNPEFITAETVKLTEKILEQVRPWFDQNNFDDATLRELFNLSEDEVEDYHEMYASSKILLGMIERMLKKQSKNL